MKKLQFSTKIRVILSLTVVCATFLYSCDTFEADPDIQVPDVQFENNELVVMANGSTFIDLAAKVKSNVSLKFSITTPAQKGELTNLGGGLLQYKPTSASQAGRDSFVFSVLTQSNVLIDMDTVEVIIENDSTQLPCGVYTADDYVYDFSANSSIVINVLENDFICSIDSTDIRLSIHSEEQGLPPYFGAASVVDNKIVYTTNASFVSDDKIIYKIESIADASIVSYGLVYISNESSCWPIASDDVFALDTLQVVMNKFELPTSKTDKFVLPTFYNDQFCETLANSQVTITMQPKFGSVAIGEDYLLYIVSDTIEASTYFKDSLSYEICSNGRCSTAQVLIYSNRTTVSNCTLQALSDSVDISGSNNSQVVIEVLRNDIVCNSSAALHIVTLPIYGTALLIDDVIRYAPNFSQPSNDKIEYEICEGIDCRKATVFIKRE